MLASLGVLVVRMMRECEVVGLSDNQTNLPSVGPEGATVKFMSDNRPMTIAGSGGAGPYRSLSLEHSSTVDRVVDELRRALFDGEIEPGTALREVALAEAIGVSRSTVREALAVLVAEGLATREPNRGVHVTALDPTSVHDVSSARTVLEVAGVRGWAEADEDARDAVRRALVEFTTVATAGGTPAELNQAHLEIHRAFVGLTGSSRLVALADALSSEIRLGLARVDRIRRNAHDQVASHRRLLTLLERGEVEEAARELAEHLEHGESSMLQALHLPPTP
jgi:DNA-binding GntR family transcriptional regulator